VPLLHDVAEAGEVGERRREGVAQAHAHVVGVDLLRLLDPGQQRIVGDGVVLVGDVVQRIDHVVGVELLAGVEFDALPQLELERGGVHPLPRRRQQRLDVGVPGVAGDEGVPDVMADHHQLAGVEIERIGDRVVPIRGPHQRVVLLAGAGRTRGKANGDQQAGRSQVNTPHRAHPSRMLGAQLAAPISAPGTISGLGGKCK
jgi:hypothetical protein